VMAMRCVVTGQKKDGTSVIVADTQVEPITVSLVPGTEVPSVVGCRHTADASDRWSCPRPRRLLPHLRAGTASASSLSDPIPWLCPTILISRLRWWNSAPNFRAWPRSWNRTSGMHTTATPSILISWSRVKSGWSSTTAKRYSSVPATAWSRTVPVTPGTTPDVGPGGSVRTLLARKSVRVEPPISVFGSVSGYL